MFHKKAVVFGGSGFVGTYVVQRLARVGYQVIVPTRDVEKALALKVFGAVGQVVPIAVNIHEEQQLLRILAGADVVVNLIGILYQKGKNTFQKIHVDFPEKLAAAATKQKVKRLVHLSALGVEIAAEKSEYAKTKLAGEKAVQAAFKNVTIVRPSIIFGAEDGFFNRFAKMANISPFLPLIGGGKTQFQPIFVGDVASAVLAALEQEEAVGKIYVLGGATVYTFKQLLQFLLKTIGKKRMLLPLPFWLASVQAAFLQILPVPPLTRDQVRLLRYDNIINTQDKRAVYGTIADLGITQPQSIEATAPVYLQRYRNGGVWAKFKTDAV